MNRLLGALTCVVALLAAFPVARAETPDSTLVMAMNIDDIISLDPAETFELVGGEVIANVYDRITVYEPGAVVELTGGVAESWDVADDGHTIILHVRPDQTFHSGNPVTAADVVFSLTRVIKLNKTPSFIFSQFGWTPENVDQMVRATDDMTVELKIPESLAPTLVLNCLAAGVGSVVDQKVALEHESNGDLGYEWLKTSSAGSGPFSLRSWKPNESVILDAQGLALRQAGDGARDPAPRTRAGCAAPVDREGRRRHRPQPHRRSDRRPRGQFRHRHPDRSEGDPDLPPGQHARSGAVRAQGARGAALSGRLPGHGGFVPARSVHRPPVVLAVRLLRLADRQPVRARRRQSQGAARRGRPRGWHQGRDGRVQHRALCRHRAGGAGDHGRGRHQRLDRTGGDQGGLSPSTGRAISR